MTLLATGPEANPARRTTAPRAIAGLMILAAASFGVASLVHFGAVIAVGPVQLDDPFAGAAIPEGVIAIVLGIGALNLIARPARGRRPAIACVLFAAIATLYGLSVTLGSNRTADVTYHLGVLGLLALILVLFLVSMLGDRRRET